MVIHRFCPRPLALLSVLAVVCNCSSKQEPTGAASGTLYLNGDTHASIYSLDMATGAHTKLVLGEDPFPTPDGTILCRNSMTQALGEYSSDGTMFRTIVDQNLMSMTTYDKNFQNPQLSPSGKYVAYEGQLGYTFDIYVVDRQSGRLLAQQNPPQVGVGYLRPTWTPDDRLVAAGGPNNPGLYLSDASWMHFTRFDQNLASPTQPAVSPDGKTVAFVMNDHIFTVGIDGTGVKQITNSSGKESWPSWSPDGKSLVLYADVTVEVVPLDGSDPVDLANLDSNFFTFTVFYGGQMAWR